MTWKSAVKLLLVIFVILGADGLLKNFIHFYFQPLEFAPTFFPYGGVAVFQNFFGVDFCIHHVTNRGAAWGVGANWQNLLLLIRVAVVTGLIVYLYASPKAHPARYPLAMVIAGGLGNILDYFIYGHVVDMFHFFFWGYSYPVFNIADTAIFCGVIGIFILSFTRRRKTSHVISQN